MMRNQQLFMQMHSKIKEVTFNFLCKSRLCSKEQYQEIDNFRFPLLLIQFPIQVVCTPFLLGSGDEEGNKLRKKKI